MRLNVFVGGHRKGAINSPAQNYYGRKDEFWNKVGIGI